MHIEETTLGANCRVHGVGMKVSALLTLYCLDSVTKTNLSVHEDKNRVPFVKVRMGSRTLGTSVLRL